MPSDSTSHIVVSKLMSLTRTEFERTVRGMSVEPIMDAGRASFAVGCGRVDVTFTELGNVTLGGILTLPRAAVELRFVDLTEPLRERFLAEFDMAFRRGGG